MDTVLVVIATSFVAHKYLQSRKTTEIDTIDTTVATDADTVRDEINHGVDEIVDGFYDDTAFEDDNLEHDPGTNDAEPGTNPEEPIDPYSVFSVGGEVGAARLDTTTLAQMPGTYNVIPGVSDVRINTQEEPKGFHEQFFPQDTRATGFSVTQKPWMIAVQNAEKPPKTEKEAAFPTQIDREDIHNTRIPSRMREFEDLQTQRTIPMHKEKKFQKPVPRIKTRNEGGGGLRGQRQLQRYHKFLLNEEPSLEMNEGPRGNFFGANKAAAKGAVEDTRQQVAVENFGVPVAASFKVGIPDRSFELEGSNAEAWLIDKHTISAGSRAPLMKNSSLLPSFKVAHDELVESFAASKNANVRASSSKVQDPAMNKFKDSAVSTQTVLGAPRGSMKSINTGESKPKAKNEMRSNVNLGASSKSAGPGALAMESSHEHTDRKLAEEGTVSVRKASVRESKSFTDKSLTLNNSKVNINNKEFRNIAAPQNKALPPHLRIAPTSSITATKDMTLKDDDDMTLGRNIIRGKMVSTTPTPRLPSIGESTPAERRMNLALLSDRMAPSNPYSR